MELPNHSHVRLCHVCGDFALGSCYCCYNFGGFSCESCKAFFRRNYQKSDMKCKFEGKCFIDKESRKRCKRCRLDKCQKIGMRKELILSPRRERPYRHPKLDSLLLQAHEQARIDEVRQAMSGAFCDEKALEVVGEVASLVQALNLPQIYVKMAIKFCKHITPFRNLTPDDQLAALKQFYPEFMTIYCAFLYDVERDGLFVLGNQTEDKVVFVRLEFPEMKNKDGLLNFRRFLYAMNLEMENDPTIRDLILVQLLFKQREVYSCPEYFQYNHIVYSHLLRRYMEHKYRSMNKSDLKCSVFVYLLEQLALISEGIKRTYRDEIDESQLAQVLAEIYNCPKH